MWANHNCHHNILQSYSNGVFAQNTRNLIFTIFFDWYIEGILALPHIFALRKTSTLMIH